MATIESIKLSEVIRLVSKPRFVLGTTYTLSLAFFESVVFPFVDKTNLKSCLILSDMDGYQRALSEAAALQSAAQDYMVLPAPISGCFHPKVWLIVGDGEAVLLVGSGNLTQAGFMNNAELFDAIHFTPESPLSQEMLESIRSFIQGLAKMWSDEDRQHLLCAETLSQIDSALGTLRVTNEVKETDSKFIHSFRPSLINQMPENSEASELYIAAPFFANSLKGLNLLVAKYPKAKLHVFPAVHGGDATDIPLNDLKKTFPKAVVSRLATPPKNTSFAHLKLYGVKYDGKNAWLCCTSANCTHTAWQGPNVEAGILRPIDSSDLAGYFTRDKEKLPAGNISSARQPSDGTTVQCWASDTGAGIDIAVPSNSPKPLPWNDAIITVRAGSALASCKKPTLFQTGSSVHLYWASFQDWHRHPNIAVWLEIEAKDAKGAPVRAVCFVEDRLQLTAEPVHRSAIRGAFALLDPEGSPDLADVSAIFRLAESLFDGTLIKLPTPQPDSDNKPGGRNGENEAVSVALWPPEEHNHELHRKIGQTATGQLKFFQRILQKLLNVSGPTDTPPPQRNPLGNQDDDDEKADTAEAETKRVKEDEKARERAERMWNDAQHNYERLYDRLTELCPTAENAKNVWPAAVYTLLSILATMHSAKRFLPDLKFSHLTPDYCDVFIRLMMNIRIQDEDFCPPKSFRYRSSRFPPLADDLEEKFNVRPHSDLALLPLTLLIDKKLRTVQDVYPQQWRDYMTKLFEKTFIPDAGTREASRRIWRTYICERKEIDANFDKVFDALFASLQKNIP